MSGAWSCSGCFARNDPAIGYCENCGMQRPGTPSGSAIAVPRLTCVGCHAGFSIRDLTLGDDDRDRCASCHVEYLKTLAAPENDSVVQRCKAELTRIYQRAWVKWATRRGPGRTDV